MSAGVDTKEGTGWRKRETGRRRHDFARLKQVVGLSLVLAHYRLGPLGYAGRRLVPAELERYGKWKMPRGLSKAELLFNWPRAQRHLARGLFVVEGPWDAMRIHQAGFPNVVALWGVSISRQQKALLAEAPRLLLMLDGDPAGRRAATRCARTFGPQPVEVVLLPDGYDPADLPEADLCHRLARAATHRGAET